MLYLCLGYINEKAFDGIGAEAQSAFMTECMTQCKTFRASGKIRAESGVEHVSKVKTIRPRNGKPVVTDGPFVETKELMGGIFIVEADTYEEAIAVASLHPSAIMGEEFGCGIEVRPLQHDDIFS